MTPVERCLQEIAYCQEEILRDDIPASEKAGAILGCCDWFTELLLITGELEL